MRNGSRSGYSEDLRRRIVLAVEGGMSKAQVARTFSVSLSSVKRYVNKVQRGESLAPKKSSGSLPKLDEMARTLLEEDLEERPFVTLQQRCDYVEAISGVSVSRSTNTPCGEVGPPLPRALGMLAKKTCAEDIEHCKRHAFD
jgi:transposase